MAIDKCYYIHTGKDGSLEEEGLDTSIADVNDLFAKLGAASKIALHVHGGLVSKASALQTAETLLPAYREAGVHPVFLVWETGLGETLGDLMSDVWSEGLFERLVQILLRHVAAKVAGESLAGVLDLARDAAGLPQLPNDLETVGEYQKLRQGEVPFGELVLRTRVTNLTRPEQERFEYELSNDGRFLEDAEAAARWLSDQAMPDEPAARLAEGPAKRTLADAALFQDSSASDARRRGLFMTAKLVRHAALTLSRIVLRFVRGRDHGVYATVVEEVLREFYFTNVGAAVWGRMKSQAANSFSNPGEAPVRGGWYLVEQLAKLSARDQRPELSIVAHSAGAIYVSHLLNYVGRVRGEVWPGDATFKNLFLFAPACDFDLFDSVQSIQPTLFENFRMFALKDGLEGGYWEVPLIYPRSLLYLVSGALEKRADGDDEFDKPLLGMQRYYEDRDTYSQQEIQRMRDFLSLGTRQVWSTHDGGPGLRADSEKHGEFFLREGEPSLAMQSVLDELR